MKDEVAGGLIDLLGALYRSLVRDENDGDEIGSGGGDALLSVLRRTGGCTMTDLSRHLRVSKPNITFLVDRLEEQGLVSREGDASDRRVSIISLTRAGRAGIESMRTRTLARVKDRLGLLDPADQAYIEGTMPRMLSILSTLYSADPGIKGKAPLSKGKRR